MLFPIGPQRYAIEADRVQEIVRAVAVARLPDAPPSVEGMINVRGRLVPVLNLGRRFGYPGREMELTDHFILARAATRLVAFRAHGAAALEHIEPDLIEEVRAHVPDAAQVTGIAKLRDGLVLIHDLDVFLSASEAGALDQALSQVDTERATP